MVRSSRIRAAGRDTITEPLNSLVGMGLGTQIVTVSGYDAFISYSHEHDRTLGPALQASLERFAKPWRKLRMSRIFIDKANLAASPELWGSVQEGLASSRWFILLASDDAARSVWVDREVRWWLEHRSPDRLLIAATSPGMEWDQAERDWSAAAPVPPALRGAFAAEPLWIDLSDLPPGGRASQVPADRVAAVAAPIRGVPKDTLIGEHLREHRRTMRLAGSAVAVLAVLTVFAVIASVVAVGQRNVAIRELSLAQARELVADAGTLSGSQPGLARQYLAQAYRMSDTPLTEGALLTSMAIPRIVAASSQVNTVAYGGGGAWLAIATPKYVLLADPVTGAELSRITYQDSAVAINRAVVGPDGHLLAVSAGDQLDLWQVTDPRHPVHVRTMALGGLAAALAFSGNGKTLAAAREISFFASRSEVSLWNIADPARPVPLGTAVVPSSDVSSMALSADGRTLAVDVGTSTALYDVQDSGALAIAGHLPPSDIYPDAIAFAPAGHLLAIGSINGPATLWDTTDPARSTLVASLAGVTDVEGVAFGPDGRTLATVGPGSVVLWNLAVPGTPTTLAKPSTSAGADDLAFLPDGRMLATAGGGDGVDLWDAPEPGALSRIAAGDENRTWIAIAPGSGLISSGNGAGATLWDVADLQDPRPLGTVTNPEVTTGPDTPSSVLLQKAQLTEGVAVDPAGRVLALASETDVSLWNISEPSHPVWLKTLAENAIFGGVAFSPDGHLLAIADRQRITLWDVTDPARPTLVRHETTPTIPSALAFSPDGRILAYAASPGITPAIPPGLWLWHVTGTAAPTRIPQLPACAGGCAIDALAFSPDGQSLAAGTTAGAYLLPVTGQQAGQARQIVGAGGSADALAFSPNGRFLAIAAGSDTIVWDTSTISAPVQAAILPAETAGAQTDMIAFSPNSRFLATAYDDGTISIWDTDLADLASRLCRDTGPTISQPEWNQLLPGMSYHPPCQATPRR